MWSSAVSVLTGSAVVLHALMGCCWHHGHGAHGGSAVVRGVSCPSLHQHLQSECSHHGLVDGCTGHEGEDGRGHAPCEGSRCVYTLSAAVPPPHLVCEVGTLPAAGDASPTFSALMSVSRTDDVQKSSPRERCALLRVWLI